MTIVVTAVVISASTATFTLASASNGNEGLFKSWRALITPILDLQNRVTQLEQKNQDLEARVNELEQEVNNLRPHPLQGNFLQIDDRFYGQDYDVVITGRFEDRDDSAGDEVTLTVNGPTGAILYSTRVPLEYDNSFEHVFSVSNDADDGVYTVKAEYGDWKTFSYFIVNEVDDDIALDLGNDANGPGDEVIISGQLDVLYSGQTEVLITVLDPNNNKLFDDKAVPLGEGKLDGDEFEFVFDLDTDAAAGRYAVIVTYEEEQGSTIFDLG